MKLLANLWLSLFEAMKILATLDSPTKSILGPAVAAALCVASPAFAATVVFGG